MDEKMQKCHAQALALQADKMRFFRLLRRVLMPIFQVCFRPQITGSENIPAEGAAVLTANHRSFWDSAFQAFATERPIRWMGKSELFVNPLLRWFMIHAGAFPVRRGQSDQAAIDTALALLERGELVAIFPEGTRVREGLGQPKRGAARLANQAFVSTVPMALEGTQRGMLRRALWHRGEHVRLAIHPPVEPIEAEDPQEAAEVLMSKRVWPSIQSGVERLQGHRKEAIAAGALAASLAAVGLWRRHRR